MTRPMRERFPTFREILVHVGNMAREERWDLDHAMNYLSECLFDYHPTLGDGLADVLTICEANANESDDRGDVAETFNEWEGRNNG